MATKTWLLTWTTYGSWLPGDRRRFVGKVRDRSGKPRQRNQYGTPFESPNPALERYARSIMKGDAVYLVKEQAEAVGAQLKETVAHRGWELHAFAIMANHVHVVLTSPAEIEPEDLLRDLKSYASRALNRLLGRKLATSWWTESGSKRERRNLRAAIKYVEKQPYVLFLWSVNKEPPK